MSHNYLIDEQSGDGEDWLNIKQSSREDYQFEYGTSVLVICGDMKYFNRAVHKCVRCMGYNSKDWIEDNKREIICLVHK